MRIDKVENKQELNAMVLSHYPVLVMSAPAGGKSYSLVNMSKEEKERTVIINTDYKGFTDYESYKSIITLDSDSPYKHKNTINLDSKDPMSIHNFFELLEKIKVSENVDRVVMDTFTTFLNWLISYCDKHFKGNNFAYYDMYANSITKVVNIMKAYGSYNKLFYVFAHTATELDEDGNVKMEYVEVSTKKHKNKFEGYFSSVFKSIMTESGKVYYYADSFNQKDRTRTSLKGGKLTIPRYSLMTLEDFLLTNDNKKRKEIIERDMKRLEEDINKEEDVFVVDII